jgi:two-component system cell cycle response regulator
MTSQRGVQTCAGCGVSSPETGLDNSLISTMGWRLRRFTSAEGESALEWRCAACWAEFKKTMGQRLAPTTPSALTQRFANVVPRTADSGDPAVPADRDTEKAISLATAPQRDHAALTVLTGLHAGRVYPLAHAETVLGRAPECDIWLEESSISRRHARVARRTDGGFRVEDLDSTNGTFLGGAKIHESALDTGDQIQLGPNLIVRFSILDAAEMALQRRLYESSTRDALTRAFNRKYLHERLAQEVAHARRHGTNVAVLMLDLDSFKKTNDEHGHLAGDAVLRTVADRVHNLIRIDDVFARYGGEEFVVLARSTEHAAATLLANRLRVAIEKANVLAEGKTIAVTASLGVASLTELPVDAGAIELLSLADARLYRAKESGRNAVVAEG